MKVLKVISVVLFLTVGVQAQTVYITKTGSKYHKENCRYLRYSKKEISLEKLSGLGYRPCLVCKPVADNKETSSKDSRSLTNYNEDNKVIRKGTSTQCTGKTKSGTRCKRKTKNASGRCYQH